MRAQISVGLTFQGTRSSVRLARNVRPQRQLATRLLDQTQATLLAGTADAADPFFWPDGQRIGFFAGGKMKRASVRGGAVITLCDALYGRGAAWADGSRACGTRGHAGTCQTAASWSVYWKGQDVVLSGFGPRLPISKNDRNLLGKSARPLTRAMVAT